MQHKLQLEYITCLNDQDNHNGVITHLERDILECKVQWALGSIIMNKTSGSEEIYAGNYKF